MIRLYPSDDVNNVDANSISLFEGRWLKAKKLQSLKKIDKDLVKGLDSMNSIYRVPTQNWKQNLRTFEDFHGPNPANFEDHFYTTLSQSRKVDTRPVQGMSYVNRVGTSEDVESVLVESNILRNSLYSATGTDFYRSKDARFPVLLIRPSGEQKEKDEREKGSYCDGIKILLIEKFSFFFQELQACRSFPTTRGSSLLKISLLSEKAEKAEKASMASICSTDEDNTDVNKSAENNSSIGLEESRSFDDTVAARNYSSNAQSDYINNGYYDEGWDKLSASLYKFHQLEAGTANSSTESSSSENGRGESDSEERNERDSLRVGNKKSKYKKNMEKMKKLKAMRQITRGDNGQIGNPYGISKNDILSIYKKQGKYPIYDDYGDDQYKSGGYEYHDYKEYDDGKGGYDDDKGGYDDYKGGYYDDKGGYDDDKGGYDDYKGGYDDYKGGYYDDKGGYDDDKGGYDDYKGGYDDHKGGYGDFGDNKGGYGDDKGGYGHDKGGYGHDKGGYGKGKGGYGKGKGGYGKGKGGYGDDKGGYGHGKGGYGKRKGRGGYGHDDGGLGLGEITAVLGGAIAPIIFLVLQQLAATLADAGAGRKKRSLGDMEDTEGVIVDQSSSILSIINNGIGGLVDTIGGSFSLNMLDSFNLPMFELAYNSLTTFLLPKFHNVEKYLRTFSKVTAQSLKCVGLMKSGNSCVEQFLCKNENQRSRRRSFSVSGMLSDGLLSSRLTLRIMAREGLLD
ncbi:hypothetical protein GQR58_020631 [Nymphon striatum]|nr:hypothetical protein GQR58_020631 [Nymphon striatum]